MHVRIKHHALFRRALHGSAVRGERLGDAGFAEFKRVELMVRDSFQGSHLRFSRRRARVAARAENGRRAWCDDDLQFLRRR